MDRDANGLSGSYRIPWTLRAFEWVPFHTLWTGIAFAVLLLGLFFIGRTVVDGADNSTPNEIRVAVTQILITAYCATAYAWLIKSARKTIRDLSPIASELPRWRMMLDRIGKHPWWVLLLVGTANILLVGVPTTAATTPAPDNPWDWQSWSYAVFWHRMTTPFFVWWIACFCHVAIVESARLSTLCDDIESIDLLEMSPYQPLVRQGLTNALLIIGAVSSLSLLAVESRYLPVLIGFWIVFIVLAWLGLMMPLRGIRRKIKRSRLGELDWCAERLRECRDALKSSAAGAGPVADIMAYRAIVEESRNWPFDSPTLVRFVLYLLIPLGSWLGGALVERAVDSVLS